MLNVCFRHVALIALNFIISTFGYSFGNFLSSFPSVNHFPSFIVPLGSNSTHIYKINHVRIHLEMNIKRKHFIEKSLKRFLALVAYWAVRPAHSSVLEHFQVNYTLVSRTLPTSPRWRYATQSFNIVTIYQRLLTTYNMLLQIWFSDSCCLIYTDWCGRLCALHGHWPVEYTREKNAFFFVHFFCSWRNLREVTNDLGNDATSREEWDENTIITGSTNDSNNSSSSCCGSI